MAEKRRAVSAALSAITEEHRSPTKDNDKTRAPTEERRIVPSERTLQGAQRRGLAAAAPVLRSGTSRDARGAHPNWDAIAAPPGKPTTNSPVVLKKSKSSVEWGTLRQILASSPRRQIIGS